MEQLVSSCSWAGFMVVNVKGCEAAGAPGARKDWDCKATWERKESLSGLQWTTGMSMY